MKLFFLLFIGMLMLFPQACSFWNTESSQKDRSRQPSIFQSAAGILEFKIVNDSMSDDQVMALVDSVLKTNAVGEPDDSKLVAQVNRALQGKIPPGTEILFYYKRDAVSHVLDRTQALLLNRAAVLKGDLLKAAKVSVDKNMMPYVSLSFNPTGTKIFAELTSKNVGKRLAIVLDGMVLIAPMIQSVIPSGEAQVVFGAVDYPTGEAQAYDLVSALRRQYHLQ